jgi:hypothetical protein
MRLLAGKSSLGGLAAEQISYRPGQAPALGLRAGSGGVFMVSQAASFKELPMQLFSWLHLPMTGVRHPRRTRARKPTARFRPQLETLEGRDLPSFSSPVAYAVSQPVALATADGNGDGKPDLFTLAGGGFYVNVQLNNGNGTFGTSHSFFFHSQTATAMAVGGGKIVLGNKYNGGSSHQGDNVGSVSVLVGNGLGSYTYSGTSYILPTNATITSLVLADLYGDGELDLVAAANSVYVARPIGTGAFRPAQTYDVPAADAAGGGSLQLAVGDFKGDGKLDIVAAGCGSATVFLNNGNGTFGAAQNYTVGGPPTAVAVGDFNRDGKLDIVTANSNSTVSVLMGQGNGTFGAAQNYAISGPANSVAVGDFNHDGFLDVVTTGTEMDLLLSNGNGTFGAYQKVGPAGNNLVAADFNGDGFPDLAQLDASKNSIDVVQNNADWMPGPVALRFGSIIYNSNTNLYSEAVTLTNKSSGALTGPMSLELTALPSGVALTDATGTTNGNPYIRFLKSGKTLNKGASVRITLTFTAASLSDVTFGTEVATL